MATFFAQQLNFTTLVSCTVFLVTEELFFRRKDMTAFAAVDSLNFTDARCSVGMHDHAMVPTSLLGEE